MPNLVTLTGPSGCGKSTTIRYFLRLTSTAFRPIVIAKYSTRPERKTDGDEIRAGYRELPQECDLVYEQYKVRYGVILAEVFDALTARQSPIMILNDVRAVQDIRTAFGGLVRSVFIYRTEPNLDDLAKLAAGRGSSDPTDIQRRFQKAQAIYRIYIENIQLFEHVILNRYSRRELATQVRRVVAGFRETKKWPLKDRKK